MLRELASAFVAMLAWESGCQLPLAANHHLLSKDFVHLAKLTVALAWYDNTTTAISDRDLQHSLETQWLAYAFNFVTGNMSTLKTVRVVYPTTTPALNNLAKETQPFVAAILHQNFNLTPIGEPINSETAVFYQHGLNVGLGLYDNGAQDTLNIILQRRDKVTFHTMAAFADSISPYTTYHRTLSTVVLATPFSIDLEQDNSEHSTTKCEFCYYRQGSVHSEEYTSLIQLINPPVSSQRETPEEGEDFTEEATGEREFIVL